MTNTDSKAVEQILSRGVEEVIDRQNLEKKLKTGKVLRVKLGIDPTSPNLHLGRAIPLLKLQDFQRAGHKIVLIIGDFTGIIGDTSDKESERPMLDEKTVKANMKSYVKQAGKILDISKCEIKYNSKWLKKLGFNEIGKQADNFSLNEFISRENISKRMESGARISLRELLYPLMQGYDSVAVKADVEIGGTDQKFNLLAGRKLQKYYKQEPQDILMNPLVEGLDGRKMSSSWGNTVNLLDNPEDMFGKVMSLKDEYIIKYFILTTRLELEKIKEFESELKSGKNPRDLKARLAKEIVAIYHGEKAAQEAQGNFDKIFKEKEAPSNMPEVAMGDSRLQSIKTAVDLIFNLGMAESKSEAKRLIEQGGVDISGSAVKDWSIKPEIKPGDIIKVGKRKFVKIK